MKAFRIAVIAIVLYVGVVVAFESLIGYFQPTAGATLVITTFDAAGTSHDRVVSELQSDHRLYVAANHWPRGWYARALDNPNVEVALDGVTATYRAVPVSGEEHDQVEADNALPVVFRFLTGFPPRYFLRLDPR